MAEERENLDGSSKLIVELTENEARVVDIALGLEETIAEIASERYGWLPTETWEYIEAAGTKIAAIER